VSDVVAAGLLFGVLAYALFGGADFGAGFWDLTAGGADRGRLVRDRIDHSLAPVWEANHTWLIYCLVIFWSAFPGAFAAVMTTMYLPLGLAALGIVLRGSGFAFRKVVVRTEQQRLGGAAFAASSIITPFFFGAVGGGIASGRVPAAGHGDPLASWLNPMSVFTGGLAVAVCAYLAAIFLTADTRRDHDVHLEEWFRRRAWAAAWVTGGFALGGLAVTRVEAPRLFGRLFAQALPLTVLAVLAGGAGLLLIRRASPRLVRAMAGLAVASLVLAWGIGQYPFLLGDHTPLRAAAAPHASLITLVVVFAGAALLVVPSLALLYVLQQRAQLESD
jgi:cytochrome d ubiquinol oxidase subunit II